MISGQISKKTIFLVLAVLIISLASLGVKLPWSVGVSSSNGKPKHRPRAVIENQIKTCKQVIKEIPSAFAVLAEPPAVKTPATVLSPLAIRACSYHFTSPLQKKSRAPPTAV